MSGLRYTDLARKPLDVLDMTSLTVDEFQQLLPAFETTFQAHVAEWRLDGKPRTARRYTTYTNCPLPSPQDRLLFILVYLKTNPLQSDPRDYVWLAAGQNQSVDTRAAAGLARFLACSRRCALPLAGRTGATSGASD